MKSHALCGTAAAMSDTPATLAHTTGRSCAQA